MQFARVSGLLALIVVSVAVVAQPSQPCFAPPPGLVNWWTFDEESGPSAADSAASRNHGVWKGAPVSMTDGQLGSNPYLCFKTSNDYVEVPDHDEVDLGAEDFTIAFTVTANPKPGVQVIIDKRSMKSGRGYAVFLHNGRPGLQLLTGGAENYIAPQKVDDGLRHRIVFAVRRVAGGGAIYIDDTPVHAFTPRQGSVANDVPLTIARASAGITGLGGLSGCLDELQVYRFVALQPPFAIKPFCRPACPKPQPELTAWWRFDEPAGTVARDSIAGAHNLSRQGTACPGISGTGIEPTASAGLPGASSAGITFGTSEFTIVLWVRAASGMSTGRRVLVDKTGTGGSGGWQLFLQDGKLGINLDGFDVITPASGPNEAPDVADGEWHMVGAAVSPVGSPFAKLWVFSKSAPKEFGFDADLPKEFDFTNTSSIRVGGATKGSPLKGSYDELTIGKWFISDDEMRKIFEAGTFGACK